ncbi:uncharacterized protein GIQ15_06058 [Arthroderma uncinatum]|uniref:uncharacterized protein n=1 Tax=Arthroderma uncinatum TaxID=74035 RepID=UPI00144A91AB|nr:uncharacterized protein GIQ15_06058 [Arthroderma uncinatum]KAF3480711.1 hypothetical protein GIQ15_06058 [Arthroderma uncinatum]
MASSPVDSLVALPLEIFQYILSYLPNPDIKNLRLTSSSISDRAHPRLDRAFLSANQRNIEVFRSIASHEVFRRRVVEIIWDDARLQEEQPRERYDSDDVYARSGDLCDCNNGCDCCSPDNGCPVWFARVCKENIKYLLRRKHRDVDRPDHVARDRQVAAELPLRESWEYYQGLVRVQKAVLASGADISAFRYGLEQFPALKRVTLTPVAHGWLFAPLYKTPMIQDFPYGFNYPIPRGWPILSRGEKSMEACPWGVSSGETQKNQWRGFRAVTRALAQQAHHHHVLEFSVEVNQLFTGVNCRIFDQPCREYNDLVILLQKPGFSRFDISLLVGGVEHDGWPCFRSGLLYSALAGAPDLQHISLCTDVYPDPDGQGIEKWSGGSIQHFIPLQTIFPVEKWLRLRHFGLSGFLVMQDDVLNLLAALPSTIRSVELSFLHFLDRGGSYMELLEQMRNTLRWRDRPLEERPQVLIATELISVQDGRSVWVDCEVTEFLYSDGINPFSCGDPNRILNNSGMGTVRDAFEPEHERPLLSPSKLAKLGCRKWSPTGTMLSRPPYQAVVD